MKTIIEEATGKYLFTTVVEVELQEGQIEIDEILTEAFESPYFNFETRAFYENIL